MENVLASPHAPPLNVPSSRGATATNLHAGTPLWFPVVLGAILWTAYALRCPSLRALAIATAR